MVRDISDLFAYRRFIARTAIMQFRYRYGGTVLGNVWHFFGPLAFVAILAIVFSSVISVRIPGVEPGHGYVLYLCSGMMLWLGFSDAVSRTASGILDNSQYVRKLAIPEIVFVGQAAASSMIAALIAISIAMLLAIVLGRVPTLAWLAVVPIAMLTIAFGASVGLLLAPISVIVRDVTQALPIILQVWMWLTPVIYVMSTVPERFQALLAWNPVIVFIASFRGALLHDQWPELGAWASMLAIVLVSFALASRTLSRLKIEVRDSL
jgi:lipopolysaccharide transport system permease protein